MCHRIKLLTHYKFYLFFPPNCFQISVFLIPKLTFSFLPSSAVLWLWFRISDDFAQQCARSCFNARFCPGPRTFILQSGELPLGEGFKSQKFEHRHAVLLGHDVVQDGIDSSAEVEEDKGYQVAVLADLSDLQGARLEGFGK